MRSTSLKFPLPRYASAGSEDKAVRSRLATSLTLAAMSLGYGVVQLDVTIVNTALNSIGASLGGGVSELQWVVSAYTIAFAAFILTAGALGDRIYGFTGGKAQPQPGMALPDEDESGEPSRKDAPKWALQRGPRACLAFSG